MKVLLVNGSPHKNGCTATALEECANTFKDLGIEVENFWIGKDPVRGCEGCHSCALNHRCVFTEADNIVNKLIDKLDECDAVIVGSPVYYAGMNGALKAIMDRAFYAGNSLVANKPAAGIASARRAGTTLTIDQINKYFQICAMPIASSTYWPMVHGSCAEDVLQDAEGLQSMRNLATQMTWMLKSFAAGKEQGIEAPVLPRKERTSFIR